MSLHSIKTMWSVLKDHEATKAHRFRPFLRFFWWQVQKRLTSRPATWSVFDNQARLRCYPERTSSNAVVYFDMPDWHEMNLIRRILAPGDGFIDIGANVGVYSVLAWTCIRPSGRILAFEPDLNTAQVLQENASLNEMTHFELRTQAVGAEAGTVRFTSHRDATNQESEDGDRVVERVTLNDVIAQPEQYTLAKVDVEGAEPGVLEGASRLLAAGWPKVWMLEVNRPAELQDILHPAGYSCFVARDQGLTLVPVENLTALRHVPNIFAIQDLDWVKARIPALQIRKDVL